MSPQPPAPRVALLVVVRLLVAVTVLGLWLTPSTATAKPAAPQLSIAVDNGRTTTAAGDKLTYTVTVTNLGASPLHQLVVTQTVPSGAALESADRGAARRPGRVSWHLDLGATGRASMHTTMRVAATTPRDLLRLATVACAQLRPQGPPLVCATDSDELPAGAAAAAATKGSGGAAAPSGLLDRMGGGLVAGGLGALCATAAVLWFARRRRA